MAHLAGIAIRACMSHRANVDPAPRRTPETQQTHEKSCENGSCDNGRMARRPRIYIPGLTQHIVQRGNNKGAMFGQDDDYRFFLKLLRYESVRSNVAIHAYTLMTNHFHLMATPADGSGLSTMMQGIGRRYVPAFNLKHHRTGGLWEGRFRSFVIETESYWLKCMRYVELNAVRAGIVSRSDEFRWSSARAHTEGRDDELLTSHVLYLRLGANASERQRAWRAICGEVVSDCELTAVRDAIRRGQLSAEP
jgi:REP-associated tyrosine transposase